MGDVCCTVSSVTEVDQYLLFALAFAHGAQDSTTATRRFVARSSRLADAVVSHFFNLPEAQGRARRQHYVSAEAGVVDQIDATLSSCSQRARFSFCFCLVQ